MTRRILHCVALLLLVSSGFLMSGCATQINRAHPLFETQTNVAVASVYFIRPFTYRERGIADNPVVIELGGMHLLELGKGDYTLVRIKPVHSTLTTRNWTRFTNKDEPIEMTRHLPLDLVADKTYYIHVRQVNEEFRGVYYLPQLVDLKTAQTLLLDTRPTGEANSQPIPDHSPDPVPEAVPKSP